MAGRSPTCACRSPMSTHQPPERQQRHQHAVVHDDDGSEPYQRADPLVGALGAEEQEPSPNDPRGAQRDQRGPHGGDRTHRITSIDVSHFVCITPGRPGAITLVG